MNPSIIDGQHFGAAALRACETFCPRFPPVVQQKEFPCCHQQDLWLTTAIPAAACVSHFSVFIKILALDCERSDKDHGFLDLFNSNSRYFHFLIQAEPRPNQDLNYKKRHESTSTSLYFSFLNYSVFNVCFIQASL